MTEPVSYRLLEAVQARLQGISIANGYRTDVGDNVVIDAPYLAEGADVCFITSGAHTPTPASSTPRVRSGDVVINIEVVIPVARATAQRDAHRVRADVLRALIDTAIDLPRDADGSAATSLRITGDQILTRPEGAAAIVVQITASAGLTERINPTL